MAKLESCVLVAGTIGPEGCCASLLGLVGQVVPVCGEDGKPSYMSPCYGASSGCMAWTCRQGCLCTNGIVGPCM